MTKKTRTDVGANEWQIDDALIRLRLWGSDRSYPLPPPGNEWIIGAASSCAIQVRDKTSLASRQHARLLFVAGQWSVHDLDSKNGIRCDGARHGVTGAPTPSLNQAGGIR